MTAEKVGCGVSPLYHARMLRFHAKILRLAAAIVEDYERHELARQLSDLAGELTWRAELAVPGSAA